MGEESVNLQIDNQALEVHLVTLFEKLESLREAHTSGKVSDPAKFPMQVEIRTLEFWRSIICECLASFVYVFVVCGAAASSGTTPSFASILITTSLAAGFSMTTLTQCFGHISGAHINPAVTIAKGLTKGISALRTVLFIIAQCGGAIAGAAFLYGVSIPGHKANLAAAIAHTSNVVAWERFGVEFILTFVVVLTYFVSMDTYRKWTNTSTITIGAAYSACTFVSMPYLNPARSLGPSFVLSKWDNHWVYWLGPLIGGAASGLIYEYILNPRRHRKSKESGDGDSSSIRSDEDTYDDLDKPTAPKFHGSTYNTYRPSGGTATNAVGGGYCPSVTSTSLYSAPPTKLERVESLYGGTKSLYCKSPPLTRANLNRSQSVYTKSNTGVNRDILPRPGPLVPAQSLYPMRLNQSSQQNHVQNQNMQNQMQQRSESIYGVRGVTAGAASRSDNYSTTASDRGDYSSRTTTGNADNYEGNQKNSRTTSRPESMYGMVGTQRRGLSAQSDDSSYGSYHGSSTNRANTNGSSTYSSSNNYPSKSSTGTAYSGRGNEVRQSPPTQLLPTTTPNSYHHNISQHSPNSQY